MYLGIDLGGTKIEAVVLDPLGAIVFRQRMPTPKNNYTATLAVIAALVSMAEQKFGSFSSIGLGTPGAVSQVNGAMKNCNSTCLNGRFLREDLVELLSKEIKISNDANCFALSEAVDGTGKNAQVVFGIILGTGVGGGIVVEQNVLLGVNGIAGEWGHNSMPSQGVKGMADRLCYCGRINCVETFLSGSGFAKTYCECLEAASEHRNTDQNLTAKQIADLACQGDLVALSAVDCYANQLAAALACVINLLDPDLIVLGGGMSNLTLLYDKVEAYLPRYVFSDGIKTQIAPPQYGDSSGVRGAAWLTLSGG